MNNRLLQINNLKANIDGKEILSGINLSVNKGEIHVIMGPNGAGKSTLAYTLMGHPSYKACCGEVILNGEDLLEMKVHERAKHGLFLSFQYPESISGVTVENFLRTAKTSITNKKQSLMEFKNELKKNMDELSISPEYANRYLNDGFSGGEKKKNEILQMKILKPKVAILDETDSGLDVDAIKIVAKGVNDFACSENAVIIITHYNKLLDYIKPNFVHILKDGKIIKTGGVQLAQEIDKEGFTFVKSELEVNNGNISKKNLH